MEMNENLRQQVKKQMEGLANDWLFSKMAHPGDNLCTIYKVQPGDVLANVAANYKVPYQFLMRINNIKAIKVCRPGKR